jgi:hypothetical protein
MVMLQHYLGIIKEHMGIAGTQKHPSLCRLSINKHVANTIKCDYVIVYNVYSGRHFYRIMQPFNLLQSE